MRNDLVGFVFALLCSYVVSSQDGGYLNSDSDSDRYNVSKETRKYLLAGLKNHFNEGTDFIKPNVTIVDSNCENPGGLKLCDLPASLQFHVEKYLDTKDSLRVSYLSKYYNEVVRRAAESNLSLFCRNFVLPDPNLNRIFYFGIIKSLNVDSVSDENIKDALQCFYFQLNFEAINYPKRVSRDIIYPMFLALHEVVYGKSSRRPAYGLPLLRQFIDQIQSQKFLKTMDFLEKTEKASYLVESIKIVRSKPSDEKLNETLLLAENTTRIRFLRKILSKYYNERLYSEIESADEYQIFIELLEDGTFIPKIFERILQKGHKFLEDPVIFNVVFNSDFLLAVLQNDPEASKQKAVYVLTRTATDPFDYDHFSSLEGQDMFDLMLPAYIGSNDFNLTQLDIISQLVHFGDVDFTHLNAKGRTGLFAKVLKSPYMSKMLRLIFNEMSGSINLLVKSNSVEETCFYSISVYLDDVIDSRDMILEFMKVIIQHFFSKSDDPLPLLLLPFSYIRSDGIASEYIHDKFNLNKKYLIDYDMRQIVFGALNIPEEQFESYYGQVIDFKTVVKMLETNGCAGIIDNFASNVEIFNEPTPEHVKPISLKAFFERVVFEEVDL